MSTCGWIRGAAVRLAAVAACLAATAARGDAVVLRVGSRQVTVNGVEQRLAELPAFQREHLAPAPELARRVVQDVLTRELLLASEAQRRELQNTPEGRDRINAILKDALLAKLREDVVARQPVTPEQVQRYYAAHAARFNTPERIRIWRILVADEKVAREIIAAAQAVDGPTKWGELARTHSKDKATAMRRGDLGFVRPDGTTDVPRVRVSAALYGAAAGVKDGEVVPDPVTEDEYLAVVWRRGTRPAIHTSMDEARPWITETLTRERHEEAIRKLIDRLRESEVTRFDPSALAALDALPIQEVRHLPPPVVSARAARERPAPRPSDRGLR